MTYLAIFEAWSENTKINFVIALRQQEVNVLNKEFGFLIKIYFNGKQVELPCICKSKKIIDIETYLECWEVLNSLDLAKQVLSYINSKRQLRNLMDFNIENFLSEVGN